LASDPAASAGDQPERADRSNGAPFVIFGTWLMVGLYLDGWSHTHSRTESFFTPSHAIVYSGFVAGVLWFAWDSGRRRRCGEAAGPAENRITLLGLALFTAGGIGDLVWHTLFGVERSVATLVSPTHLLLMMGGILMLSAPIRDAWARPGSRLLRWSDGWPVVGSLLLTVALILFFLMYLSPFRATQAAQPDTTSTFHFFVENAQIHLIAAVLVTTAVWMSALLFILRRWDPPFGTFALVFGITAVALSGLDNFQRLPLALAAVVGGLAADGYIAVRYPIRVLAMVVPLAIWLPYFVVFKSAYALPWEIHLWLGTIVLAVLSGLGLSLLAVPPALPTTSTAGR
jgi:hypothetical protein